MARYNQEPFYLKKLREAYETESIFLDVDCEHLYKYNPKLYGFIEDYPTDVIPIFDLVAQHVQS